MDKIEQEKVIMFKRRFVKIRVAVVAIVLGEVFCALSLGTTILPDFEMYSSQIDPVVKMAFDAAGYSDWWDWGRNDWPRHPYSAHEMLSGEWAGAVHYDGIASGNQAMWLTDQFSFPNWPTSTGFTQVSFNSWDHPVNPIDGLDTAQSVIQNAQVRITIDYEMVDLDE